MNRDELQGRWILAQGWLAQGVIDRALRELPRGKAQDLCGLLVRRGLLDDGRANRARAFAGRAGGIERAADSDLALLTPPGPAEPVHLGLDSSQDSAPRRLDPAASGIGIGRRFRGYELRSEIGRGAMGVVYRARAVPDGQVVALKLLLDEYPAESDLRRFEHEIQTLIRLKHPHIVEILDSGRERGHLYYAMSYVQGEDLEAFIEGARKREGRLPDPALVARLLLGVAEALAYCHLQGVLHRDVKPRNVLVDSEVPTATLVDFGLMKKAGADFDSSAQALTQSGELVGTPAFMAPEQAAPAGRFGPVGPASDVWGFGATLFFGLTGTVPFLRPSLVETLSAITTAPPPNLRLARPDLPGWLEALCLACLNKEPAVRPSMAEVSARLRDGLAAGVRPRRRWFVAAAGAALLAGLAGLASLILHGPPLEVLELRADQPVTRAPRVRILGRLSGQGGALRIARELVSCDAEARFAHEVPLVDGENRIAVAIEGRPEAPRILVVWFDAVPPQFDIETPTSSDGVLIVSDGLSVQGRLRDRHPLGVRSAGVDIPLSADGRFALYVPNLEVDQDLALEGLDKAGNTSEARLRVRTPLAAKALEEQQARARARQVEDQRRGREEAARRAEAVRRAEAEARAEPTEPRPPEPSKMLRSELIQGFLAAHKSAPEDRPSVALLADHQRWESSAPEAQERAAAWVARALGDEYEPLGVQSYVCGAARARIAAFRHRKTAVIFQLIPGEVSSCRWWANPDVEFVVNYLDLLASPYGDLTMLELTISAPPYRGFNEALCKTFNLEYSPDLDAEIETAGIGKLDAQAAAELRRRASAIEQKCQAVARHFYEHREDFHRFKELCRKWRTWYLTNHASRIQFEYVAPFLIGRAELSQEQWDLGGINPGAGRENWTGPSLPVHGLLFESARAWLEKAGAGFRFPTRLEWARACQGGSHAPYPWGSERRQAQDFIWGYGNSAQVEDAARHAARSNAFGLIDVLGNVQEWADPDWATWERRRDVALSEMPKSQPAGDWALFRASALLMGGAINWHPLACRADIFRVIAKDRERALAGLRVARTLP